MGILVMPAGVIAAILAPLGLAQPALWVMGEATAAILVVADFVTGLRGAVQAVPAPPAAVLPLLALGGVAALIARPLWLRGGGAAAATVAFLLWAGAERPPLLISGDGGLVGLMGDGGRVLSKPKGAGFVAQSWLEDDGDLAAQETAFARGAAPARRGAWQGMFAGHTLHHLTGKTAPDRAAALCADAAPGTVVVLNGDWPEAAERGGCEIFDLARLNATGALAVDADGDVLRLTSARDSAGTRLWNTPRRARPDRRQAAVQ